MLSPSHSVFPDYQMFTTVKKFKYHGCEISYENDKDIQLHVTKFTQIPGILICTFKIKFGPEISSTKHNALTVRIILCGSEIWTLRKKRIGISRDEIFQKNRRVHYFLPLKEWRNFGKVGSRTSWRETKKTQIKLVTGACNKNEQ